MISAAAVPAAQPEWARKTDMVREPKWRLDGFNSLVLAGAVANGLVVLCLLGYFWLH